MEKKRNWSLEYYHKHKNEINEKRRLEYQVNPKHKEQAQKRMDSYRLKHGLPEKLSPQKRRQKRIDNLGGSIRIIHGMTDTPFHRIWISMRQRCTNQNSHAFNNYGGRGIKVCERWEKFENFKADMYQTYLEHLKIFGPKNTSIDRINNDGNYEPHNCRWATKKEQVLNRRT